MFCFSFFLFTLHVRIVTRLRRQTTLGQMTENSHELGLHDKDIISLERGWRNLLKMGL